jgi:mono/diheme cytochrome c family protein
VLDEYARKFHAGPGWLFLTGSKADIDLLSRKLGLYAPPDPANPDGHLPYLLVGNQATGQWMRNSAVDNPKFLARTIGDWLNDWKTTPRTALTSYAESATLAVDVGRYTFGYHCAACHTIGGGAQIGPDLNGVTARRDRDWLRRFIAAPDRMNADGDAIAVGLRQAYGKARMPNLDLSDEDVAAVIDYIDGQSRARRDAPAAVTSPTAAAAADSGPTRPIVDAYLRVQQALYEDTLDSIRDAARTIESAATALGPQGASIRATAAAVRAAADLNAARAAFGPLSDRLIAQIRSDGAPPDVSIAFCPMAHKYWLQRGRRIQNPYYGQAMPDCGGFTVAGKAER